MAEIEKYVDGLTEAESEDMAVIVNKTIKEICLFSDKHNFDRDNMLKYYAELIWAFAEVSTIQGFEAEKPQTNADRIRSMTDEELAEWLTNMCEFEENGEPYKSIYNLDAEKEEEIHDSYGNLLKWLKTESEG